MRSGTDRIDPETRKSITELEYLEAHRRLESGKLHGLLAYVIHPAAAWPLNLVDRNQDIAERLRSFKETLRERHTVEFFHSVDELPFQVLRDVINKLDIGVGRVFRRKKPPKVTPKLGLNKPVGMEFYTEELARHFHGRGDESQLLLHQTIQHQMSLLIGESGTGKTSLMNAGLFPLLRSLGWRTALVRPLTAPIENITRSLWNQLLAGPFTKNSDLSFIANAVSIAYESTPVLIVIDQFEDILGAKASQDIEVLTSYLIDFYRTADSKVRILISYRGDVESQIGPVWQKVSGSADGLPRMYLGPLTTTGCAEVITSNLASLKISLKGDHSGEPGGFVSRITGDLATESLISAFKGVYPPFVQMILSRIAADAPGGVYRETDYEKAGTARSIISDYLIRQLRYLGKDEANGRAVLIALVSAYGVKTQKTVKEIADEAFLNERDTERLLRSLIDLRMVRGVSDYFEIVHDFLAMTVLSEITSTEERDAKKFKNLLTSRAAAFTDTKAPLTETEHLQKYKHRHKIHCSDDEVKMLLDSYLTENRPIFFWLQSLPGDKVIAWLQPLIGDGSESCGDEYRRNACRLVVRLGERLDFSRLPQLFSGWKERRELAGYISSFASSRDTEALIKLSSSRKPEIAEASSRVLVGQITISDEQILEQLSKGLRSRDLFERISLKIAKTLSLGRIRDLRNAEKKWQRLLGIYCTGVKGTSHDLVSLEKTRKDKRNSFLLRLAAVRSIIRLADRLKEKESINELMRTEDVKIRLGCSDLIDAEFLWTAATSPADREFIGEFQSRKKGIAVSKRNLPLLKKALEINPIEEGGYENLISAIWQVGGEAEFEFFLGYFLRSIHSISIDSGTVREISKLASRKHRAVLKRIVESDWFWLRGGKDFPAAREFRAYAPDGSSNNEHLVRWLAAFAFARLSGRKQFPVLRSLLMHPYWTVRHSAAGAILRFAGSTDLPVILDDAIKLTGKSDAILKVLCELDQKAYPTSR